MEPWHSPHKSALKERGETGSVGTPQYLAPEMALADHASFAPSTDVFLLGAVLYQILTGEPPYAKHRGETALFFDALTGYCLPPSARAAHRFVPVELEAVLAESLLCAPI